MDDDFLRMTGGSEGEWTVFLSEFLEWLLVCDLPPTEKSRCFESGCDGGGGGGWA